MRRILTVLAAAAVVALGGCATEEGYRQHMAAFEGQSGDAIQIRWGVPDQVSDLSDGTKMWVYHRTTEVKTGGYETTRNSTRVEEYTDKDGKKAKHKVTYSTPYYEPVQITRTHCETRFIMTPDNVVKSVTFEGDGCVAEEIDKK